MISTVEYLSNYKTIKKDIKTPIENLDTLDYNCGGFALGTFDWFVPYDDEDEDDCFGSWMLSLRQMVVFMLRKFSDLRRIKNINQLKENEYAIAFRRSEDDFHYIRRFSDGTWAHKCGVSDIKEMPEKEVFSEVWETRQINYDGRIVLFAKQY